MHRIALLMIAIVAYAAGAAAQVDDAGLKAAFVYNFALFTEWPAAASRPAPALSICVHSRVESAFYVALETLEGKSAHGRLLRVRSLGVIRDAGACDIVVLSRDGFAAEPALRGHVIGRPVLTVCECSGPPGGEIVRLVREGSRFGFSVDRREAAASGLVISSKLLRLAGER